MLASVSGTSRRNVVPLPGSLSTSTVPFQTFERGLHHVQADAAAGNFRDFIGGAEARRENQLQSLRLVQPERFVLR